VENYLLGEFIKNRRAEMRLSLRDFGSLCGISHTTIDCIEKGYDPRTNKPINITNSTFGKLSKALNVPISDLVELSQGVMKKPGGENSAGLEDEFVRLFKSLPLEMQERELAYLREYAAGQDK